MQFLVRQISNRKTENNRNLIEEKKRQKFYAEYLDKKINWKLKLKKKIRKLIVMKILYTIYMIFEEQF